MPLAVAIMLSVVVLMFFAHHQRVADIAREADAVEASAHALMTVQNALLRWHIRERAGIETGGFAMPTAAEAERFANGAYDDGRAVDCPLPDPEDPADASAAETYAPGYLPPPCQFAGSRPYVVRAGASGTPVADTVVIDGLLHGYGDRVALVWNETVIEIHLFGNVSAQLAVAIGEWLPQAVYIETGAVPHGYVSVPPASPGGPRRSAAHAATRPPGLPGGPPPGHEHASVAIRLPHPVRQTSVRSALARGGYRSIASRPNEMTAPLPFDGAVEAVPDAPCGATAALTTTAEGVPMACVDSNADGLRMWKPLHAPTAYCRDTRLSEADSGHRKNAPFMVVAWPDRRFELPSTTGQRVLLIPGTVVRRNSVGGIADIWCPDGFAKVDGDANGVIDFCSRTISL